MFERYTEKARRVVFFARYEASQYGSEVIDTEHLLLGLLREHRQLLSTLIKAESGTIRSQIEARGKRGEKISTSVDLPLTNSSKRVLHYASEEADRLGHKWIGTDPILLGLLREKSGVAAEILQSRGLDLDKLRERFAKSTFFETRNVPRTEVDPALQIHGIAHNQALIQLRVRELRAYSWHWHKTPCRPRDLAVDRDGKISFDLALLEDKENFTRSPGAWKKDRCNICAWELCDSAGDPAHNSAYTNGRDWVCQEYYEKFLRGPDYFESPHSDIT